jgi:hypothetical protein
LKFGRYFDKAPWFGMELETRFSRNNIPGKQGTITPPQPFQPSPLLSKYSDWFMIWAIQVNLLARYGFLKDKEVTFGRLQPYIGLGTGFNIDYARYDSTKNFALETQAGLKYMVNKNVGIFVEYKFTYQFAIEYQDHPVYNTLPNYPVNALPALSTFTFDQPHHMVVLGVAWHFKNLYGNYPACQPQSSSHPGIFVDCGGRPDHHPVQRPLWAGSGRTLCPGVQAGGDLLLFF